MILDFSFRVQRSRVSASNPHHYNYWIVKIYLLISDLSHFLCQLLTILGYLFYHIKLLFNFINGSVVHTNHLSGHQIASL